MAKKKPKPVLPFLGRWRIVSMTEWDEDYVNEEVPAFIEFDKEDSGSFQFGYVQGEIDCRTTHRERNPAVEFSWEGSDGADGTPLTGRGWAMLRGIERNGGTFIHSADESEFEATRATSHDGPFGSARSVSTDARGPVPPQQPPRHDDPQGGPRRV